MPPKAETQLSTKHAIAQQPRQLCLRDQARYRDSEICFLPKLFDFCPKPPAPSAAAGSVTPGPIGGARCGPDTDVAPTADLASGGPAIAAACRRLRDECV